MTRRETGRTRDAGGPGLQRPQASPGRGRALRPRRGPARPPRSAQDRLPAPASLPAPLRAAALLALALLAAAPPARAAKPVLRTTNPITIDGIAIALHYDQNLDTSKRPNNSQFTVTVGVQTITISGTGVSGSTFRILPGFRIAPDEAVTVAYAKPTSGLANDPIQNSAGEEADAFSAKTATNSETWSATAVESHIIPAVGRGFFSHCSVGRMHGNRC